MKNISLLVCFFCLAACTKKVEDTDTLLTSTSMLGSTMWIATFNGNSYDKQGDCQLTANVLNEKYPARKYFCENAKEVLERIKKENK
ncbi:MAG: hypothetical protein AABY64_09180 [Bdellovibrionota bacterium]